MALKGNLLYNGDLETGDLTGWETEPFGKTQQFTATVTADAKLRGNYGLKLSSDVDLASGYIAYDKVCSFEEYEGYLFIFPFKMLEGFYNVGKIYGMDDKGNLIDDLWVGYNNEKGAWKVLKAILRGFGDITHFKIGGYFYGTYNTDIFYIDEVKLIPLRSLKGHVLTEYKFFDNVTANKLWYSLLACIGRCELESIIRVTNVSGTSPTLDTEIQIGLFDNTATYLSYTHTQFTSAGVERKKIELPEVCWIKISYTVGGTDPSFDIYHHLRLKAI